MSAPARVGRVCCLNSSSWVKEGARKRERRHLLLALKSPFLLLPCVKPQHPHQGHTGNKYKLPIDPLRYWKHIINKAMFEDEKDLKGAVCSPGLLVWVPESEPWLEPQVRKTFLANLFRVRMWTHGQGKPPWRAGSSCSGRLITCTEGRNHGFHHMTLEPSFVFPESLKIDGHLHVWSRWSLPEKIGKVFVLTNHLASDVKAVWRKCPHLILHQSVHPVA